VSQELLKTEIETKVYDIWRKRKHESNNYLVL